MDQHILGLFNPPTQYTFSSNTHNMASCKSFILLILVALSFPGLDKASAAGNRRLLAPSFPGIPNLPSPFFPTFPGPTTPFPPLLSSPSTPNFPPFPPFVGSSTPNSPPTTFPGGVPFPPAFPPPQTAKATP
ncbi:UNVERIFIED_CONTAM: hypothetical protein Sradi_2593300 [Sesamum radiatum]|uniref:Uncharacterized protein n=1 Tax=Sesamum radiatum TaxID=300843 RepID=A0AAW2S3I3_SESRA